MSKSVQRSTNIVQCPAVGSNLLYVRHGDRQTIAQAHYLCLSIDLVFSRFYLILFVGKDRRHIARLHQTTGVTKIANQVAVTVLLPDLNLTLSAFIFLTAYLVKSAVGVDLFPLTLQDIVQYTIDPTK